MEKWPELKKIGNFMEMWPKLKNRKFHGNVTEIEKKFLVTQLIFGNGAWGVKCNTHKWVDTHTYLDTLTNTLTHTHLDTFSLVLSLSHTYT